MPEGTQRQCIPSFEADLGSGYQKLACTGCYANTDSQSLAGTNSPLVAEKILSNLETRFHCNCVVKWEDIVTTSRVFLRPVVNAHRVVSKAVNFSVPACHVRTRNYEDVSLLMVAWCFMHASWSSAFSDILYLPSKLTFTRTADLWPVLITSSTDCRPLARDCSNKLDLIPWSEANGKISVAPMVPIFQSIDQLDAEAGSSLMQSTKSNLSQPPAPEDYATKEGGIYFCCVWPLFELSVDGSEVI